MTFRETRDKRVSLGNLFVTKSCKDCMGECCVKVTIKVPENLIFTIEDIMPYSRTELEEQGCHIVWEEDKSKLCKAYKGGECTIYDERPRFCRSYFCHFKYWKPKKKTHAPKHFAVC